MEVGEIQLVEVGSEFRVCPKCGYELGFHVSFLNDGEGTRIILVCPNCGARYDTGWNLK